MTLHRDLLDQASSLAKLDKKRPKQANLRRAVSATYYAMFHLLIADASSLLGTKVEAKAKHQIGRAFAHTDMRTVCEGYAKASIATFFNAKIGPLLTFPVDQRLRNVAQTFVDLQEARHLADYDLSHKITRIDALARIATAESAFSDWAAIRRTSNASIFMIDLLLRKAWSK